MSGGTGMKCKKCRYFYRMMAAGGGYNPFPCCHILEDAGKHPKPLTQECFEPRKDLKRRRSRNVWFDTGIEYTATKQHLKDLEEKYGITIERRRAKTPVPLGCKTWGQPFMSKQISQFISRLQAHNFQWEDEPFDVLYQRYPNCKAALRWWCNEWGPGSQANIGKCRLLKEFMIANPPDFPISDGCCKGAKKDVAHDFMREIKATINMVGIRKAEKQNKDLRSKESFSFPSEQPVPVAEQPQEAKGRKRSRVSAVSAEEIDSYRALIRENIDYEGFVRDHPYDAGQLDEMVELMVETVCSRRKTIRVAGNDFPQEVVKSRLLKLERDHIEFVFDCLKENTSQVRNPKQYLLAVLYNASATIENHYAARVNHDLHIE